MNDEKRSYYKGKTGLEAINLIDEFGLDFCLGNALKYIVRAGKKDGNSTVGDIEKAIDYLKHELEVLRDKGAAHAITIDDDPLVLACVRYMKTKGLAEICIYDLVSEVLGEYPTPLTLRRLSTKLTQAGFKKVSHRYGTKREKMWTLPEHFKA